MNNLPVNIFAGLNRVVIFGILKLLISMLRITFYFLLLFLIPSVSICQIEEKPQYASGKGKKHRNKTDELGQKQGLWKMYNSNGQLMSEIEYVNNQKHGVQRTYYPYEKIMEETEYQYGVKEGEYKKYYYSGQVSVEGQYVAGKKEERWSKFYSDGQTQWEGTYKRGVRDGEWKFYDRKGNMINTTVYKNGVDVKELEAAKAAEEKRKQEELKKKGKGGPPVKGAPVDTTKKVMPPTPSPLAADSTKKG